MCKYIMSLFSPSSFLPLFSLLPPLSPHAFFALNAIEMRGVSLSCGST